MQLRVIARCNFLEAKKIPFDADLQNPSDLVGFRDVFRSEINTPEINVQISKEDFSKHEDFFSRKDLCFLKNNFLQKSNPI